MERKGRERIVVTLLRCAIGWHFLYEGATKIMAEDWSAAGYLANAQGPLSGFYHWLASSDAIMGVIDPLNMYGLAAIGLGLFLGVASRWAAAAGVLVLGLYYFAYPSFGGTSVGTSEGSLYIVNRNVVEALALLALVFVKEPGYGIQGLLAQLRAKIRAAKEGAGEETVNSRREALKHLTTIPALGLMGAAAYRDKKKYGFDALSGATIQVGAADLSELKGELPKGTLGNHQISRLVLGGNLIGGWAHARDLIYASSLFRAYNTEAKIFETLQLAEKAGINSINIGFPSNPVLEKYKRLTGSKIKVISQVAPEKDNPDLFVNINKAIDYGADIIQIQGNWCDWLVRDGKIDDIAKMLDKIRSQGYVAGLGAHTVDSLIACEDQGVIPDYYMKTMHHDNYWSAHPRENRAPFQVDGTRSNDHNQFHDNIFCLYPERTAEFVQNTRVPVMGFKVLAAGALTPQDGFHWAFKNGADFICVGMFDFQIVNDVNITLDVLKKVEKRERDWSS